jgi:hypothetical protein
MLLKQHVGRQFHSVEQAEMAVCEWLWMSKLMFLWVTWATYIAVTACLIMIRGTLLVEHCILKFLSSLKYCRT